MNRTAVQIGEKLIQVIVERKQRNQWELINNVTEPLPEGIVKNGQILEPEKLGLILKELFLKNEIKETHASAFIEEAPFFLRRIKLPRIKKSELASTIHYRAQTELPVNPNELVIRYYPLQQQEKRNKEVEGEYMIVAMDKGVVSKTKEVFHNAGLTLSSLSLEPIVIYNGLFVDDALANQLQKDFLLVRTDTSRLLLAIFSNGRLVHSRYLPFSTDKHNWEHEISRTLKSWNSVEENPRVGQIVLYGQLEHVVNIKNALDEDMSVTFLHNHDPLLPCKGMIRKKYDDINFYADRVTFNLLRKTPIHVYALTIITGFMLLSLLFQYGSQAYIRAQIGLLKGNISEHSEIQSLLQKQKQLENTRTNVLKTATEIRSKHIDPIDIYQLIAPPTAGSINFSQIAFDHETIKITGRTGDVQTLINYYLHLQQNPNLVNIIMNNVSNGPSGVQFSLVMNRKGSAGS